MLKRILVRLLLQVEPIEPEPIVHRGEREITIGPDLGAPSGPIAKLSAAEAERLLGIPVRIIR